MLLCGQAKPKPTPSKSQSSVPSTPQPKGQQASWPAASAAAWPVSSSGAFATGSLSDAGDVLPADLQDAEVRKLDGRSDRFKANLDRDLNVIKNKLEEHCCQLSFYDEQHYIGTGEKFKKKVGQVKEALKKVRASVLAIPHRIDRTKTPDYFKEDRDACFALRDKIDAATTVASLVVATPEFDEMQAAIASAAKLGVGMSATFTAFSFWRMFDHYLAVQKYDDAVASLRTDTSIVEEITSRIADAPDAVKQHLMPQHLASCALEKSVESCLFTMTPDKPNQPLCKTNLGRALNEVVKRVSVTDEMSLVHRHAPVAGKMHSMLSAEDVPHAQLGEALSAVIPDFADNVDAAPFLDENPDPLLKLMGCTAGRLIIEQARKVYIARNDEAQYEQQARAVLGDMQNLMNSIETAPASADSLAPKLKAIEDTIGSLNGNIGNIKSKTLQHLIQHDVHEKFFNETYPAVLRAPCSVLLSAFRHLPRGDEVQKKEKWEKFYEDMTAPMEVVEGFKPEKLQAYLETKATDNNDAAGRKKLFEKAMGIMKTCVSFLHWLSVYDLEDGCKSGANADEIDSYRELASNGGRVYVDELHGNSDDWQIFQGSALMRFSSWHQKLMQQRAAVGFVALGVCAEDLAEHGTGDKGSGDPVPRMRVALMSQHVCDADAAPFHAFGNFVELCTAMSVQAHM